MDMEEYLSIVENMPLAYARCRVLFDDSGHPSDFEYLSVNKAFERHMGVSRKDIIGKTVKDLMPKSEEGKFDWVKICSDIAEKEKKVELERYIEALGGYYNIELASYKKGELVIFIREITSRKEFKEQKEFLEMTLHSIGDGFIGIRADGSVDRVNEAARTILGLGRADIIGKKLDEILYIYDKDDRSRRKNISPLREDRSLSLEEGIVGLEAGGQINIEYSTRCIIDSDKQTIGGLIVFRDISSRKKQEEKILHLSYHDQMTGLYNRRFFEEEVTRLDRERNMPLSFIMVDVNGLKLTSDAFGHFAGDDLLKGVARVLKRACRADDIVARVGGDEFSILLPDTDREEAKAISDRIHEESKKEDLYPIVLSVSTGFATKHDVNQSVDKVMKRAEDDMYQRKLRETRIMREKTIYNIIEKNYNEVKCGKTHSEGLSSMLKDFGRALDFGEEKIRELGVLGKLHDIGLVTIEVNVLNKKESLTDKEYEEVKRHSEAGYQILKSVNSLFHLSEYVLSHHERIDGKGYPNGLRGSQIPIESKMLSIVDAYESMTNDRTYRKRYSKDKAIEELRRNRGSQFDRGLVDIFVEKVLGEKLNRGLSGQE